MISRVIKDHAFVAKIPTRLSPEKVFIRGVGTNPSEPENLQNPAMKTKKILSLLLAVILPVVSVAAADAPIGNLKSGKPVLPGAGDFIDNVPAAQTTHAITAPEPPSIALILAGALAFVGLSILRHRAQL
jgi:hypothetical protein